MGDDDVRKLGGKTAWEIEKADAEVLAVAKANTDRIVALEKQVCENGRPSLENRMKAYIDAAILDTRRYADDRDTHKSNSSAQAMVQMLEMMKDDRKRVDKIEEEQDKRHESNVSRFNKLETRMATAVGAAMVIQVVLAHVWK